MRTRKPLTIAAMAWGAAVVFACGSTGNDGKDNVTGLAPSPDASQTSADGANGDGAPGPEGARDSGADSLSSGPDDPPEPPGPRVRFIGRFDGRDPAGPVCAWPGCRIVANFAGTGVSVKLNETVYGWMQGGPSEWDVIVDGVLQPKLVLDLGIHDYVLAQGLPDATHSVELYKRSESQNGLTQFMGYDFGAGKLLPPPKRASRRIEIIGDSAVAGFGIEGVGLGPDCPGPDWSAHWQNFHLSFAALLGEMVNAEVSSAVYSGKGLVKNIWRPDTETMPLIYTRADPIDPTSVFDFSTFKSHVIIVMIGGNDFAIGQGYDDGPTSLVDFTDAARKLVTTFRSHTPLAHVFFVLSPSVTDEQPPNHFSRTNIKTAWDTVTAERVAAGDSRVHSFAPGLAPPEELTACNGHGTPAFHQRVAQELAVVVRAATGW